METMPDRTTVDESQEKLLRRIAAQDREALAELYDELGGVLYATACRIIGDPSEAEEVMQDVFVQIWERAGTFDPAVGTPTGWAVRITRNRSIDRLRSRQRRQRALDDFETEFSSAPSQTNPNDRLNQEELASVRSALDSLGAEQRRAIELAFFGGLSHGEISATLKQPLGTVKAHIRRGMIRLKESLQAYV
jgi:RNA polymerase sigma-70 factor, ECF subfamily